jgi:hypothetical protein
VGGKKNFAISKSDTKYTLSAIRDLGFDSALEVAFSKAVSILEKKPDSDMAIKWLSWSTNLLDDARRSSANPPLAEQCYTIAYFYRKLAHKTYWYQRTINKVDFMMDFIQGI